MEDDDEFGDLYTDVLLPFTSSSSSAAPPHLQSFPAPKSIHRPIDLNNVQNDEEDTPYGAPNSKQTLVSSSATDAVVHNSNPLGEISDEVAFGLRVPESEDVKLEEKVLEDAKHGFGSDIDGVKTQSSGRDELMVENEVNFDIEEADNGIDDVGSEPVIPGLSSNMPSGDSGKDADVGGDDWESDSEDDLQIVLNDNDHGPMAMERGGMVVNGDDDEDEDGLVIVADGDPNKLKEEQDWGEDAAQFADGERKETGEPGKAVAGPAGVAAVPKIAYSSHGYHPFHSQFKYVRPGAASMLGATPSGPAGVTGQVRPLVGMGSVGMAGRGRGEWRPPILKNAPQVQKNFHSGFGMPIWGSGRGFGGGLEFTLPSHKTIFEVDIDSFEEKPWKHPGVDVSDFFNFGFNEESWKDYCKQLEQLRLESTMQSKIRVYESARTEQDYDPDLPPELAAATGIHDVPVENANHGKMDGAHTHSDILNGPTRVRPPLPTGRAIQVEGGNGERLPSIDTRPPRIRDSVDTIEIIPQGSLDDDNSAGNDAPDTSDSPFHREDSQGGHIAGEGVKKMETEDPDSVPQPYNGQEREPVGTQMLPNCILNEIPHGSSPDPPESPGLSAGSIEQSCLKSGGSCADVVDERQTRGKLSERSPQVTPSRSTKDKKCLDDQPEDSVESLDGKCSAMSSSPARESSFEHKDTDHDDLVIADGSSGMEKDEMASTKMNDMENGESKKKALSSRVQQPIVQEFDEHKDSKAARSSDNNRARSGSSKDYQRFQDGVEEEVMQCRPTCMVDIKRHLGEKEQGFQRKYHDGKQEPERSRVVMKGREDPYLFRESDTSSVAHLHVKQELERSRVVMKGREDPYLFRESDTSSVAHLHVKSDGFERRKERNNLDEMWQHRDDDPYNKRIRNEESRKREHGDEVGSRHRGKVRESDRIDKDELVYSRKKLENGNYRVYHDKDVGGRHRERDDNLKGRYEYMDDYYSKRWKDEEYLRRDRLDREEMLHDPRENTSRRKRERDGVLDPRKRGDQQRFRENLADPKSLRLKDEGWLQRERDDRHTEREEWQRLKKSLEENISNREKEEGCSVARGGCSAEEKAWFGHAWTKEENKASDKEYQHKETVRHSEPSKRRDKAKDGTAHHLGGEDVIALGNQASNEKRRFRHERSSTRNSRAFNTSDEQKLHEKKHKDNTKRNKESEASSISVPTKRNQDHSIQSNETGLKSTIEQGNVEQSSRRPRDNASSDDEVQDSRKGRSKLERWTSHKERDYSLKTKSSSTLKIKEIYRNNSGSLESSKPLDEPTKPLENVDTKQSSAQQKDAADQEMDEVEEKPSDDNKHLDTIEKLKKRSERFKPLPVPSEKDALATKKLEPEPQPSANNATPEESEIKPERPARKRRWIGN